MKLIEIGLSADSTGIQIGSTVIGLSEFQGQLEREMCKLSRKQRVKAAKSISERYTKEFLNLAKWASDLPDFVSDLRLDDLELPDPLDNAILAIQREIQAGSKVDHKKAA